MDDPNVQKGKGAFQEVKGKVKEAFGDATDNESVQSEGLGDQAAGKVKQAVADVRKAGKDLLD